MLAIFFIINAKMCFVLTPDCTLRGTVFFFKCIYLLAFGENLFRTSDNNDNNNKK